MPSSTEQDHVSRKRVVYTLPDMQHVIVRRDQEYARCESGPLTMDLYYPHGAGPGAPPAVVVFVTGFRDVGAQRMLGCRFKDMGSYISWAQLVAASGMVAITYVNDEPVRDAQNVFQYLQRDAAALGIDANRMAVWSCSGNVPTALSLLMLRPDGLKCAVLCYGYMLDHDTNTSVADAARQFGFANPCAGKSIEDLPPDLPLFIVRAGQDEMPRLNESIERFVQQALERNLPITFVNHPDAPHAFDVWCDDDSSRGIIADILQFMRDRA